ncbi:Lrp/AsnC family transcriptional regulator [soil metagenome]
MDAILELLHENGRRTAAELAALSGEDEQAVAKKISGWEEDGTILGYQAVIDGDRAGNKDVEALIEVRITPERNGGFNRVAERISKFEQVVSCVLMSGGYDLAVLVRGGDLRDVARFVSEKLASLDGVLSTATHFRLKVYKQNGLLARPEPARERLPVSP